MTALLLILSLLAPNQILQGRPRAAAGPSWSPSDEASLAHWYKGDEGITTDTGGVSQWDDQEGSADLTQSTSSRRPDVASSYMNGIDGVQFINSTDDCIGDTSGWSALTQPVTVGFMGAWDTDPGTTFLAVFDGHDSSTRIEFYNTNNGGTGEEHLYGGSNQVTTGEDSDTSPHYWVLIFDGASTQAWKDGVQVLTDGDLGASQDSAGLSIGSLVGCASGFTGEFTMVEWMIFDADGEGDFVGDLNSYLATRSGV